MFSWYSDTDKPVPRTLAETMRMPKDVEAMHSNRDRCLECVDNLL